MKPTLLLSLAALITGVGVGVLCAGCPDPQDVGAIPHQQVEDAKVRVDKAEKKLEQRAAEADAARE